MTAPVPGLSDERLAEIEADHDSFRVMVDHNASTCPKCSLLREVVRLREERDKAQRQIEKARWLVGDPVAYEDDEPIYADVDLPALADVLTTEDGQTSKQSPIGCPDVEPHEPHQYTVTVGGVTCEGGLCDGVAEETTSG